VAGSLAACLLEHGYVALDRASKNFDEIGDGKKYIDVGRENIEHGDEF
jgi:hypothetical protein